MPLQGNNYQPFGPIEDGPRGLAIMPKLFERMGIMIEMIQGLITDNMCISLALLVAAIAICIDGWATHKYNSEKDGEQNDGQ
jgi:hypothetical protein